MIIVTLNGIIKAPLSGDMEDKEDKVGDYELINSMPVFITSGQRLHQYDVIQVMDLVTNQRTVCLATGDPRPGKQYQVIEVHSV